MGGHRTRHRSRLRPGRIITQVIVFLLLGAIVNVAVAWACALLVDAHEWAELRIGQYVDRNHGDTILDRWDKIGSTSIDATHHPPRPRRISGVSEPGPLRDLVPWWIPRCQQAFRSWPEVDDDGYGQYIAEARGFPMPTFWQEFEMQHLPSDGTSINEEWVVHGGIPFLRGSYTPRSVPLRPIWRGFALNTVFYAIILWLLIPGPFVLRRLIRIKRGRCPKCGYDLRGHLPGAGCPECGWNREVEA